MSQCLRLTVVGFLVAIGGARGIAGIEAFVISDDVIEEGAAKLHRIDLATGATEFVGDLMDINGDPYADYYGGLGFDATGRLLGATFAQYDPGSLAFIECCSLIEIDTESAVVTPIGKHYDSFEQTIQALEWIDTGSGYPGGGGYLAGYGFVDGLGTVDSSTGVFTKFGGTTDPAVIGGLAYDRSSDILYGINQVGSLFRFEPATANIAPQQGVFVFDDGNFLRALFPPESFEDAPEYTGVLGAAFNHQDGLIYVVAHLEGPDDPDTSPGEGPLLNTLDSVLFTIDASEFDGETTGSLTTTVIGDTGVNWLSGLAIRYTADCDLNGDGRCDGTDLNSLDGLYSAGDLTSGVPATGDFSRFDMTADGTIDGADLAQWLATAADENGFASTYLVGDANLDGTVSFDDFVALANSFPGGREWFQGNFDGSLDGTQFDDFVVLAGNFGQTVSTSAAVPEPQMGAFLVGLATLAAFRRRRFPRESRLV